MDFAWIVAAAVFFGAAFLSVPLLELLRREE